MCAPLALVTCLTDSLKPSVRTKSGCARPQQTLGHSSNKAPSWPACAWGGGVPCGQKGAAGQLGPSQSQGKAASAQPRVVLPRALSMVLTQLSFTGHLGGALGSPSQTLQCPPQAQSLHCALDSPWTPPGQQCSLRAGDSTPEKRRCSPSVCRLEAGSCAVPTCSLSANLHRTAETVSPAGFLRPAPEARRSALGWPVTCFAATRTHPLPAASHPLCFLTSCSRTNCCSRQLQMIGWEEKGARRHGEPGARPWVWALRWPCRGDWEWI